MHYSTVATFLTLAGLFTTGSASCYGTGEIGNYGKNLDAVNGLQTACYLLTGTYVGGESRMTCVEESGTGVKWSFDLKHISGGSRYIGLNECLSGMSKEAHGCYRGGDSKYWNWEYKADPNTGSCNEIPI
ncbi:hypothetical protein F5B22DRAFT_642978 [Xylaria bambusicola]|uniref:uncharacterized protein n=1 Tax=Xylaria bambusicola TaxID=326684 RepID=UPI0020089984|nr:uncharacterized protein F5B22DRAFT_642978 [Xylaria bambusicola]KAI0523876.1 hypothetical protein F5B22DRAFT_642978 [Xylaria bambusicola]